MKAQLITVLVTRIFTQISRTSTIRQGQVGLKVWISRPYSKPYKQIRWVALEEYQAIVTLMILATEFGTARLYLTLPKYRKTFDLSKYYLCYHFLKIFLLTPWPISIEIVCYYQKLVILIPGELTNVGRNKLQTTTPYSLDLKRIFVQYSAWYSSHLWFWQDTWIDIRMYFILLLRKDCANDTNVDESAG